MTIRAHDKVEVFDVYKEIKLLTIYKLSIITIIDEEVGAKCVVENDPLQRVLMGQGIGTDSEA